MPAPDFFTAWMPRRHLKNHGGNVCAFVESLRPLKDCLPGCREPSDFHTMDKNETLKAATMQLMLIKIEVKAQGMNSVGSSTPDEARTFCLSADLKGREGGQKPAHACCLAP
uniref:Uncharacterized protein n=1 Tax=Setaria viridis TaxID=4556 RepID=A0A4U6TQK4_SETVI|nr:hypothetical protein SEVIR_7G055700v2 [Setaria viridis]